MRKLLVALFLLLLPAVFSWGQEGHLIVAKCAFDLLPAETRRQLATVLQVEKPLHFYADRPDAFRRYPPGEASGRLHYINAHGKSLDMERDCADSACVVGELRRVTHSLFWNPTALCSSSCISSADDNPRPCDLSFLVHLVADVHQPFHASRAEDRGGNDTPVVVRLTSSTSDDTSSGSGSSSECGNLHSVWDNDLLRRYLSQWPGADDTTTDDVCSDSPSGSTSTTNRARWRVMVDEIVTSVKNSGASAVLRVTAEMEPLTWALQSYALSEQARLVIQRGQCVQHSEPISAGVVDEQYYKLWIAMLKQRLTDASVRLALVLQRLYGPRDASATTAERVFIAGTVHEAQLLVADSMMPPLPPPLRDEL